ncbi:MAG: nucleotide-binding domain containing protein, partial [Pseudomonadota bacterium]
SELPVAHLSAPHVWAGAEALRTDLAALPHDRCHVIVDAIRDQDLRDIARATEGRAFMVGGSGIAIGMPELFGHSAATSTWTGQDGPGAILSGSCSRATRGQVAAFDGPTMTVSAEDILSETCTPVDAATWVMAQDRPGLVTTSSDPAQVTADQDRFGRETVAAAVEGFHAATARALSERGVRRIVVAGGETSGAVVEGLGLTGFEIGPRIAAGVPALQATDRPLTLALKSGNFGGPDFFELALATLGPAQAA